jgi:palmitoyltransferase ZDHHC9/14/18
MLVMVTAALHLVFLARREHIGFRESLKRGVGSAVVFCLSLAVIWPIVALFSYHMRVSL